MDALSRHLRSKTGRVCQTSLLEDDAIEKQATWIAQPGEDHVSPRFLPQQYEMSAFAVASDFEIPAMNGQFEAMTYGPGMCRILGQSSFSSYTT
jgi:hypothetical protein